MEEKAPWFEWSPDFLLPIPINSKGIASTLAFACLVWLLVPFGVDSGIEKALRLFGIAILFMAFYTLTLVKAKS